MRALFWLLLVVPGCSYPELARAPEERTGPPPALVPLDPLLSKGIEPDTAADADLQERASDLRTRAADIAKAAPGPDTELERRVEALRERAAALNAAALEEEADEAPGSTGQE